ncbi:MAG TPA: transcriptional regulator [Eubacteriaceae bacterium]|nr:transcriptional regulator [Eubacteriaceae bacterium]
MSKRALTPFGMEVKMKLIESGKTQKQLAEEIGASRVYLSMILYGKRSGDKYKDQIKRNLGIE